MHDLDARGADRAGDLLAQLAAGFDTGDDDTTTGGDAFGRIALDRRQMVARAVGDMKRLATSGSIQES